MLRLISQLEWVVERIGRASAWLLLGLVLWVITNVLLRYLFDAGWVWAQQLEWQLLPPLVLLTIAYTLRHNEHVRVDIFYDRYPPRAKHVVGVLTGFFAVMIGLITVYLSLPYVAESFIRNEGSYEPGGIPYRFLVKSFIPIGFLLLAVQGLTMIVNEARELLRGVRGR